MPKSLERPAKESPEMFEVFGDTIGKAAFEVCPDEFVGIELRGVSRKIVRADSRIACKEFLGELGLVERAAVPEKNDRSREVTREMPEKLSDLFAPKISVGIEACVESEAFPFRRDGDGRDRRDFFPASGNNKDGGFSFLCPSLLNVGDEREPALIQEDQAGSKPSGLFLYEAKCEISSNESLALCVPWLSSAASGNSIPKNSSDSINFRCNIAPETASGRSDEYVSESTDPSKNLLPGALPLRSSPSFSSERLREAVLAPDEVLISNPPRLFCGRSDANAPRSLTKLPLSRRWNGTCTLLSVTERPDAAELPTFWGCHEVSSFPPSFPLKDRLEFVSINC